MSVTEYLSKHVQRNYLTNGHLRSFTQYPNNYTFLLASTVDQIQNADRYKVIHHEKTKNQFEDEFYKDESVDWNFKSIDWNQAYTDLLKDIDEKFRINNDCNSIVTLYLTFPSYPENNLLLNFFKEFESSSSNSASSTAFNDGSNLYYRNTVNPVFLSFVDALPLSIFQQIARQHANVRLVFCGHGLGGTIAQLSTLHLLSIETDSDYSKLRSISVGSLFFAEENTVKLIKEHHLEQHFINIYHEMDVISSLFNMAGILSKLSMSIIEPKPFWSAILDSVTSFLSFGNNPIEKHRFYLKHILSSLCHSLSTGYSIFPSKLCETSTIDKTLDVLKEAWKYAKQFSNNDQISKSVYYPIGIFNLILFRKHDETWHLVNVINIDALNDHLNTSLERLSKSQQIFRSHSISHYMMALHQCNKQKDTSKHTQTLQNVIKSFVSNEYAKVHDADVSHALSLTDNNIESSIVIPFPFSLPSDSYADFRSGASYMSMIATSPFISFENSSTPDSQFDYLTKKFLSAIKHRTNVFKVNDINKLEIKNGKRSSSVSIYDICLSVYETYGMDARMELMKLQLDQRMLVPILVSTNKTLSLSNDSTHFRSYIKTLTLVETPVLQFKENILSKDSELLRIGLISTKKESIGGLPNLIKNLFHVSSIRQFSQGMGSQIKAKTIAETGYGFLPNNEAELFYQPVILIHIIGDYRSLISFLVKYVDVLIVEHNENDNNFHHFQYDQRFQLLRIPRIMKWKHTIDQEFDEVISYENPYLMDEFQGSAPAVTSAFQAHLLNFTYKSNFGFSSNRPRLIDMIENNDFLTDDSTPILDTEILFKHIDLSKLKKEDFQLQLSYKKEAEYQLQLDNPILQLDITRKKKLEEKIRTERNYRSEISKTIEEIPLFESYLSLLSEPNDEKRYTQKRYFEFALSEYNEVSTELIRRRKDQLFNEMKDAERNLLFAQAQHKDLSSLKEKEKKAIRDYYQTKTDFIQTSLVIDHFWREISHLYIANQTKYHHFPHLAAQHLIDGFSLELLDGDSMLLNIQWIKEVLHSLDKKLFEELVRPARILVLSICGPQSSGKSYLLKTMYGIRIRSSVGACTQGVNMMLVKVLDQNYDYIFLLDTEGIRAPEFSALEDAGRRDNFLASFAVLPADGTILLNKGEINQALEDVLPIVLYLFATSSLSKQLGGQIPSKLFFVYNQIDPSQPQKGMELLQDLMNRLQNVTHRIIEAVSSEGMPFYGFDQCRLDLNNFSNSDFRILSTNVNNPPINHPVYLFGEQSLALRHWIHQRITNTSNNQQWKPRSISGIIDYLRIVSDVIRRAPHITSVTTSLEIFENSKLNIEFENIQYNLSTIYNRIRSEIEKKFIDKYTDVSDPSNNVTLSQNQLNNIINDAANNVSQNVNSFILEIQEEVFQLIKGTKRQVSYEEDWKRFLRDKEEHTKKILTTKIVGELINFDFYGKTQKEIQRDFIDKCDHINCTNLTDSEQKTIFNKIMKNYTKKIQEQYSFESINVSQEIRTHYNNNKIIESVLIFNQNNICYDNGSAIKLSDNDLLVKHMSDDQKLEDYEYRQSQEIRRFNDAISQIEAFIDNLINNANRYEQSIVDKVLMRIKQIINERSIVRIDTINYVHRETFCLLEHQLIDLQNKWNLLHNRTQRLEDNRPQLWEFFQNVVQGVRGIQLFQLVIYNAMKDSWRDAFIETLIDDVVNDVSKEKWIGNSNILLDKIDKVKIQILKKDHGIKTLLNEISSPDTFYKKCMIDFVQVHVNESVNNTWKKFHENLIHAIRKAGENATLTSKDRLNVFLVTLRSRSLPSAVRGRLPVTANIYGDVDSQPIDLFHKMFQNLTDAIPNLKSPEYLLKGNESEEVLNKVRKRGTDAAKPRCNHACKLCGAPCFKHAGHDGSDTNYHDFHHQPAGLNGMNLKDTHLIIHSTCHEAYIQKYQFSISGNDGPYHPYTEFPKILHYEVPASETQRSFLGEYLMSKYHYEIAKHYNIKPNPPTPIAYDEHTLETIERDINGRLGIS